MTAWMETSLYASIQTCLAWHIRAGPDLSSMSLPALLNLHRGLQPVKVSSQCQRRSAPLAQQTWSSKATSPAELVTATCLSLASAGLTARFVASAASSKT